ncbi:MAG: hypothetical protein L6V93_03895 [Clostridiales bacterium]|nr:MAG: hypothetical protein L6V93_03895 [Clostridiales bacterium]
MIQFGEGGFLRGFVDWIIQETDENTDFNASVVVVQPIEKGNVRKIGGTKLRLYPRYARYQKNGVPTVEKKIIDVISRTVEPYKDFNEFF